jgi:hypothetical protein
MRFRRELQVDEQLANGSIFTIDALKLSTYNACHLTVSDGDLTVSGTPTLLSLSEKFQIAYPAKPTGGVMSLSAIVSGSADNVSFNNMPIVFKVALKGNGSYTLRVNVRTKAGWAGSNIYWDETWDNGNGRLTFAPAGIPLNDPRQQYQGVYFKWGSLVGLSAAYEGGSSVGDFWYAYNTAYVPNPDGTWTPTKGLAWGVIPQCQEAGPAGAHADMDFFENYSDYPNKIGDICRYLGAIYPDLAGYRMPTARELMMGVRKGTEEPPLPSESQYWQSLDMFKWATSRDPAEWPNLTPTITDPSGKATVEDGLIFYDYAFFPSSGGREDGHYIGKSLLYWSSSPMANASNYAFMFVYTSNGSVFHMGWNTLPRRYGYSVRCIHD